MNEDVEKVKREVDEIQKRNLRVEMDKAWETSLVRKALVTVLTYIVAVTFFYFARIKNPFLNAVVPTLGFIISTLSISFFKNIWIKKKVEEEKINK